MFRLHVVLDQSRDWIVYVPLWVTALAALITVVVAVVIARNQAKLQQTLAEKQFEIQRMQLEQQERQLRKDLFARRFAVFTGVQKFFDYVLQKNGDIELHGPGEYRQFRECMERAEMLFGSDVNLYLKDVDETARAFYVSAKRRGIDPGDVCAIDKDGELLSRLSVTLMPRRKGLFCPYLTLFQEGS
jgi:hypothetical protein